MNIKNINEILYKTFLKKFNCKKLCFQCLIIFLYSPSVLVVINYNILRTTIGMYTIHILMVS